MNLLAISTSGNRASCACINSEGFVSCRFGEEPLSYAETLMYTLEQALTDAHMPIEKVDVLAVDVGPGSFTGVRIGVSTVNALAYALHKPVVEVDSLHAMFVEAKEKAPVCCLLDARNQNGYAALFDGVGEHVPLAVGVEEYVKTLPKNVLFLGDGAQAYREMIERSCNGARFLPGTVTVSAKGIALAAVERFANKETVEQATPKYLRPSQAERMHEKNRG